MKGYFIYNEFLKSTKFHQLTVFFQEAASRLNIQLIPRSNSHSLVCLGQETVWEPVDFVVFWDKDIGLAREFERRGIPVYNSSEAIQICDNKCWTHQRLAQCNIPMPKTILGPMTYPSIGYTNLSFLAQVEEQLGYPMILKEAFGSFGEQVYFIENSKQLKEMVERCSGKEILFQENIPTSYGRDIRLQVVGDEVVAAMYRESATDFRANVTNGASMKKWEPTKEQQQLAIAACRATKASFAGVDLLFGKEEEPLVCEVNSNGHFVNLYECTGVNVAEKILKWIQEQHKEKRGLL